MANDTSIDTSNENDKAKTDIHCSSSISVLTFKKQSNGYIEKENESIPYKPTSSHLSTPIFSRSSHRNSVPIVPMLKPASSHISTPIPSHKHSSLSIKRSSSASEVPFSPTHDHHDCSSSH